MNIAGAAIVTHSTRLHNRLIHSRRAIERIYPRFICKSGHRHGCRAVLQCDQHFAVFKLPFIATDELMLKIDNSLAGSRDFTDERQTHLAVSANFLRLIRDSLIGIGNLDHISGREPYRCLGTWWVRQRRQRTLAAAQREGRKNQEREKAKTLSERPLAINYTSAP